MPRRTFAVGAGLLLAVGCTLQPVPVATPGANPSPSSNPSPSAPSANAVTPPPLAQPNPSPDLGTRLEGAWAYDTSSPEPTAGPVVYCGTDVIWIHLTGENPVLSRSDEGARCGPPNELFYGRLDGPTLEFAGTRYDGFDESEVRYQLTYNASNQHWTGTRNGQPFWLAPRRGPCASPPVGCDYILRGRVYHQDGRLATEPGLTVKLEGHAPVPVEEGRYVIPYVALDLGDFAIAVLRGEQLLAMRSLPAGNSAYLVNFGGPGSSYGIP